MKDKSNPKAHKSEKSKQTSRAVLGVVLLALGLRLGIAGFTELGSDQKLHYEMGLAVYQGGPLPVTAVHNVYTGTSCPGVIVPLAFSVPLFFSNGHPIGDAIFLALLGFLTAWLTFTLYRELFPKISETIIAIVVLLSPWGVLFSPLWQPPLLPICGWMMLKGFTRALKRPRDFWGAVLMTASVVVAFQVHLSFAILALLWIAAHGLLGPKHWNWKGWVVGGGLSGLTLIPYLLNPPTGGASTGLGENVKIGSAPVLEVITNVFLRLASFPTGETTRFIGNGLGFGGAVSYINAHPWLWPMFLVGMLGSIYFVGGAVTFYFQKKQFKNPVATLVWLAPFFATLLFFFSIKPPSAHTIWILWPFAFYPLFWFIEKVRFQKTVWWGVGIACSLVYSIAFVVANYDVSIFGQRDYIARKLRSSDGKGARGSGDM